MISTRTLRNIHIQDFIAFFRRYKVSNWTVRIKPSGIGVNRYDMIKKIIDEEISSAQGAFKAEDLDNFLFEQLYYANNEYHFLYDYNDFAFDSRTSTQAVITTLQAFPALHLNSLITDWNDAAEDSSHITLRVEETQLGKLAAIHVLVRVGLIDQFYGKTYAFCGVKIDPVNQKVLIKFNHQQFESLREPITKLKQIREMFNGIGVEGARYAPLRLNITLLNEDNVLATIYELFAELSKEAEDLLDGLAPGDTEDRIKEFLISLGVTEPKVEYIEQIKNVVFQDISTRMDDEIFNRGWVFRFQFREGDHTRASSRNEKRLPVYGQKSFWQLKELVHSAQEMHEAGFHWNMNQTAGDSKFVDVRIESKNGTMLLHYYYRMRVNRKEKEEYVVRKVSANLQ